jgi:uncharacterized protein (TIGR03437 family)
MTANPASVTITYAKGSGMVIAQTSTISSDTDATLYTAISPIGWLSSSPGTGVANTVVTGGDTLTLQVVPSVADHMAAGTYHANVPIVPVGGGTPAQVAVTLSLGSATSPLSTSAVPLSLIKNGVANQPNIKYTATIADNDTLTDTYTVQSSSVPAWLTVTPNLGQASMSASDTIVFALVPSAANALTAGLNQASVHLQVAGQPDLVVTVNFTLIVPQPMSTTTTADNFAYTAGSSTLPGAQGASITVASGSVAFTLDASTVPAWLTATASGTATVGGATVTFTPVSAVIKGLAAGNYSGSIGYLAAYAQSELLIPVVLTVSNPTATISLKGAAHNTATLNYPGATAPQPVVSVVSSDEPIGFSATCTVATTNPTYVPIVNNCSMAGASTPGSTVTGIAYTFGTPLTTTFDPLLFSAPFGTVVTETVVVTAGTQSPVQQTFAYTIQPVAPTFTALSPTSAAQIAVGDSLVVTLTGTNFVAPGAILTGSSQLPTQVFVGGANVTSDAVVINSTTLMVSVPQASFPSYPTGKTTVNMVLGVANQTTSSTTVTAPTVTQNLVLTTAPVIYAVTSTATYKQPNPGSKPNVAPYELISIFGANFGFTGSASASGTLSSYLQFGTSVTSGTGTSAIAVSVTFKVGTNSFKAPILFADANQINAVVPSGLTVGSSATVTVSAGTVNSDGLFAVSVVAADPGIFTLASDGVGPGAILNADYSVNQPGSPAAAGDIVAIYLTGLGVPNSAAVDNGSNAGGYPTGCVAINGTTSNPGYLQVVNTTTKTPAYTAPTPAWSNIDGAVINSALLLGSALPPCLTAASLTNITVTFGTTPVSGVGGIYYAGFAPGAVAGLYQINVKVPELTPGNVPVTVTLGTQGTSPAGVVTIAVH